MRLSIYLLGLAFLTIGVLAYRTNSLTRDRDIALKELSALHQTVETLHGTISLLKKAREADANAVRDHIIKTGERHERDIQAAVAIAQVPAKDTQESGEGLDIDAPLPLLSKPLVVLYREQTASTSTGSAAPLVDDGDKGASSPAR